MGAGASANNVDNLSSEDKAFISAKIKDKYQHVKKQYENPNDSILFEAIKS